VLLSSHLLAEVEAVADRMMIISGGRIRAPPARNSGAAAAGVRRRFAPPQLRHAHAVEMAREGVPLIVIQRQLGHSNLGITSVYLQGIDNAEIIDTVHARRAPMIPVSASLRL
jgi:integrase